MNPDTKAGRLLRRSSRSLAAGRRWEWVLDALRTEPQELRLTVVPELMREQAHRMLRAGTPWSHVRAWLCRQPAQYLPEAEIRRLSTPAAGMEVAPGVRLLRPANRGGYGEVWEASRGRGRCAVKFLRGPGTSEDFVATGHTSLHRRRLRDEALLLKAIAGRSRHFPAVHRCLEWRGQWVIVMEWVDGLDIRTHCHERRLGMLDRISLSLQVAEALAASHHAGVAHLDLKPANILVTRKGGRDVVKLIDFGIGRRIRRRTGVADHRSSPEVGEGRPRTEVYASPEQVMIEPPGHDWRSSDVYSLAVVIHELVYGFRPWQWIEPVEQSWCPELGRPLAGATKARRLIATRVRQGVPRPPHLRIRASNGLRATEVAALAHHRQVDRGAMLEWFNHGPLWLGLREALMNDASARVPLGTLMSSLRGVLDSRGAHSWELAGRDRFLSMREEGSSLDEPAFPEPDERISRSWMSRTRGRTPLAEVVRQDVDQFDTWERRDEDTMPLLVALSRHHLPLWLHEASLGNGMACWLVGQYHELLGEDPKEAMHWYRRGDSLGDSRCLTHVSLARHAGLIGGRHDPVATLAGLRKAVSRKDHAFHWAAHSMAMMLRAGNGTAMDERTARRLMRSLARRGDGVACLRIAMDLARESPRGLFSAAIPWLRKAAELNVTEAQSMLAEVLLRRWEQGLGGDPSEVLYWLAISAASGEEDHLCWAALMHARGHGCAASPSKALELLRLHGDPDRPAVLHCTSQVLRLRAGRGDVARALSLCSKAARKGHARAQLDLAVGFSQRSAARLGDATRRRWLREAARQGLPEACYRYALLLTERGRLDESKLHIDRAANSGYAPAMHALAVHLERGDRRSAERALAWHEKAAHAGIAASREALLRLRGRLAGVQGDTRSGSAHDPRSR